jgi:AAA family ATP:ADP antiporter
MMARLAASVRGCAGVASAVVLFAFMLAHGLLETARDALFIATLGPEQLAWAYLAIAVTALAAVALVRGWIGARDSRRILIGVLAAAAFGTALLAWLLAVVPSAVFVLYVWTGLVATLVVPTFWLTVERATVVTNAKRSFAAIAAGGGLGALLGSALAAVLGRLVPTQQLVALAAVVLGVAALLALWLAPRALADTGLPKRPTIRTASTLRSQRYVRLLLLLGMVAMIALTLGDLMFKRVVATAAAGDLTTAFGAIYTLVNLLSLAIQLFVTSRLLERLGVGGALTVLPIVVLASTLGFLVGGAVIAVFALRVGDGALRHSVHRVASEILFMPLSSELRDATKPVIDVIAQRGGQVIAALLAFTIAHNGLGTWQLGAMLAIFATLWLAVIVVTRRAYVQQFRDTLAAGTIQRDARIPTLDANAIALLTASLSSPDEREAIAALDLLDRRAAHVPALVLYHPSPAVVRRALAMIDRNVRPDVARVLAYLISHPDPQIRAAALAASSRGGWHTDRLRDALRDPAADVRATAAVCLIDFAPAAQAARNTMRDLLAGTVEDRAALARAAGHRPIAAMRLLLGRLVERREPQVVREVLQVWATASELANIDLLLGLLEDPHVRGDARRAFLAGGAANLARATAALDDPRTPLGVRRHLPRTISRFRSPAAAATLVARLIREPDGMTEFKILRALGRMRADDPTLPIDADPVRRYVLRAIEDARRYSRLGDRLRRERAAATAASELLADLLVEKRRYAIDRVFRALGILYPEAEMRSLHDALTSIDDERIAAALEILDGQLDIDLRVPLVELIAAQHEPAPADDMTYEALLAALLADPSDSLRCVAAHHVAERRLVALRGELVRLRPITSPPYVTSAFDQAVETLDA